jgi:hypothetical protein
MRVIIRRGILWPGKSLGRSDPDFKLLNREYDTVTSIKRKQLSFVAGCIAIDSAELSAQNSGEADGSRRAGQKRWTTA